MVRILVLTPVNVRDLKDAVRGSYYSVIGIAG